VATVASEMADEMWRDYRDAFTEAGVRDVVHLQLDGRPQGNDSLELLEGARGVFFTGGDQLSITSKLGGTPICERIHEMYFEGGVIAGTSAGASALSDTMIVSGPAESHRIGAALLLAPGLAFLPDTVIDQHFGERGRIGRLLGIVGQNPRTLGIGIDENTAVVIKEGKRFEVVGAGAVYVIDGRSTSYTNFSESEQERTMSVFDVRLHVLSEGDSFDLDQRRPQAASAVERQETVGVRDH